MKAHAACLVALVLVASSANAASLRRVPAPRDQGNTVGDLMRKYPRPPADGLRQKVIKGDSTEHTFIFAAAGSVQGAGGTFFRSDVSIVNHRNADQMIAVGFLAQGVDNSNAPLDYFTIDALTPVVERDVVGQLLHKTGLGTLLIQGVLANGDIDTNATLDGSSRIWTPQPGGSGSVSQGFPSVSFFDSFGTDAAYALALRHDSQFRTNVGVVNLDDVSHTWSVTVNGIGGITHMTITVPPISMRQQVVPSGNWGDLLVALEPEVGGFWWSAYGAGVDNASGDSWSSHASQPGF